MSARLQDLAQEVRDEDHRPAARRQPADDLVEALHLLRRERGRRLVEDDQLGVARERAQDLDLLLLRERQARRPTVAGAEIEAGVGDQRSNALAKPTADR